VSKKKTNDKHNRDVWTINVDLHCHSTFSDGVLEPADLIARAHGNGVQVLALTDHDETSGLQSARESARACGMTFINGVEISVTWAGYTIHVVGLGIDPDNAALVAGLSDIRKGRDTQQTLHLCRVPILRGIWSIPVFASTCPKCFSVSAFPGSR